MTLYGNSSKLYFKNAGTQSKNTLRSVHDTLMKSVLGISQPKRRFANLATESAYEFCKGITFFMSDAEGVKPFYHRDNSCGPATLPALDKFSSSEKKFHVRNCYFEREIYNQIYKHIYRQQDIGHLDELKTMEQLYFKYFSDFPTIDVKVQPFDIIPLQLRLVYRDNDEKISETYTKLNKDIVQATREVRKGNTFTAFDKIQHTNEEQQPWIRTH